MFCVVTGIVSVVLGLAGFELSSCSTFCNTCHYMKPYVAAWKASNHSSVPCAKCHYPLNFKGLMREKLNAMATTIRYFVNTYDSAPTAEIEDANCLQSGCHEKRLLSGPLTYKRSIKFDHEHHLKQLRRGKQLKCTTCHSQIVQGEHISVTQSVCFICHFKGATPGEGLADCTLCHDAPKGEVEHEGQSFGHEDYLKTSAACRDCHAQVTRGDGNAPRQRCFACHTERREKHYDSELIHNTHVTEHKVECFECHNEIEHGKIAFVNSLESPCDTCHSNLHSAQKKMFMGVGAKNVTDCPDPMFSSRVGCNACHRNYPNEHTSLSTAVLSPENQHTASAHPSSFGVDSQRARLAQRTGLETSSNSSLSCPEEAKRNARTGSCETCHSKGYDDLSSDWQWAFREYDRRIQPLFESARVALQSAASSTLEDDYLQQAKELFGIASYNYDFVKKGCGVHNALYAKNILLKVQEDLNKCLALLSPGYSSDDVLGIGEKDLLPGCTQRCHVGISAVRAERDVILPHSGQTNESSLDCGNCHDGSRVPDDPKHGGTECTQCHHTQNAIFVGQASKNVASNLATHPAESSTNSLAQPSPHTTRIECKACHDSVEHVVHDRRKGMKASVPPNEAKGGEAKSRCDKCHVKGTGDMIVRLWQKQIKEPYDQAKSSLGEAQRRLTLLAKDNTLPRADIERAMNLTKSAEENLELVRKDGSWGVHNFGLIQLLVTQAGALLKECNEMLDSRSEDKGSDAVMEGGEWLMKGRKRTKRQ